MFEKEAEENIKPKHRVISVQYFEQTENTSTHVKSLRFPVFLELKEEGQLPNN